jgi:hypothetical protein
MCAENQIATPTILYSDGYRIEEKSMQFRLLYSGRLLGAGRNNPRADHKAQIRGEFSPQIERLIATKPLLRRSCCRTGWKWFDANPDDRNTLVAYHDDEEKYRSAMFDFWVKYMADKWRRGNQGFVPLITDDMDIRCGLEILFLRPEEPGMIVRGADLDNRLKTLLDALRIPDNGEGFEQGKPPIFCLLQDDRLISEIKVTADQLLLLPKETTMTPNDVFLVVNVGVESPPSNNWHPAFA